MNNWRKKSMKRKKILFYPKSANRTRMACWSCTCLMVCLTVRRPNLNCPVCMWALYFRRLRLLQKKAWRTFAGTPGFKPKGKICDSNRVDFSTSSFSIISYLHSSHRINQEFCTASRPDGIFTRIWYRKSINNISDAKIFYGKISVFRVIFSNSVNIAVLLPQLLR